MPIHAPFLKYFREVVASGSVRTAARRLHISSSAVNRQILKIEDELGVRLFERKPGGMVLTTAGHVLAGHVERTLVDAERCHAEIAALGQAPDRPLTIAGQESVIAEFLPPVLVELHAALPGMGSAFVAAGGDQLNRLLLDGTADVAIAFDRQPEAELVDVATRTLAVGAIVAPGHPLAIRSALSVSECAVYPLILPDRTWPLRTLLDDVLERHGIESSAVTTSNSVEFLRSMINQQLGVGFQTAMGLERRLALGELKMVPLVAEDAVRQQLGICLRVREQSASLGRLVDLLEKRLDAYAKHWAEPWANPG